jgi:hypothetical protein
MRVYSKKSIKRVRSFTKQNRIKRKTRSKNLKKTLRKKRKQRGGNSVPKENHIYSVTNSKSRNHYAGSI